MLVENGSSEYVIVLGSNATATEQKAATELQKYIKAISGAKLSVVTDNSAVADKEIIVGRTTREGNHSFNREELGEEGFVVKTTDSKLWLAGGGDRGTLYSVYTFLEEYLGCRFYTKDIEKVPTTRTILLEQIKEDKQTPTFVFRDAAWRDYYGTEISVKRKVNARTWGRQISDEYGGDVAFCKSGGHTFSEFVNPDKYFAKHPEYFSMNESGVRVSTAQLCLTNKDVQNLIIAGVRSWLEEQPDAQIISVSQNDAEWPCLCNECKKVYEEEGGAYSGTIIRMVNMVAEAIADDYPNVLVDTYAYNYSRSAPITKAADNVVIRLCSNVCCMSHPYDQECKEFPISDQYGQQIYIQTNMYGTTKTFMEDLNDWMSICDKVYIYDYPSNVSYYIPTFPYFTTLFYNCKLFAEKGVTGIMAEGNTASYSAEFGELRAYLLSKLMWNPYMTLEEYYAYMDDFLTGVYGPGGTFIRDYIELAEELTQDICYGKAVNPYDLYPLSKVTNHAAGTLPADWTVNMLKNYQNYDWTKYFEWYTTIQENRITSEGEVLFAQALNKATTKVQREQILKVYSQVEYLKSYYYGKSLETSISDLKSMLETYISNNKLSFLFSGVTADKIVNYAKTQQSEDKYDYIEYEAYNRALAEKLVSYGISYYQVLYQLTNLGMFDFTQLPENWSTLDIYKYADYADKTYNLAVGAGDTIKITLDVQPIQNITIHVLGDGDWSEVYYVKDYTEWEGNITLTVPVTTASEYFRVRVQYDKTSNFSTNRVNFVSATVE